MNKMAQHKWTETDIGTAIRILAQHATAGGAVSDIASALGRRVTRDSLDHALKSRGFGTAQDNLGAPAWTATKPANDTATAPTSSGLETWLVIPDVHVPFHHVPSWNLMLDVARDLKPTKIISLGDFADCYAVSFHPKSPDRKMSLRTEVDAVNEALDQLDALGAKRYITLGNHEHRLARYINERCSDLFGLVDLESLVGFRRRGWHVTDYRDYLTLGDMNFTHETGDAGAYAHNRASAAMGKTTVIGHTHRMSTSWMSNLDGSPHVSAMLGCLVDFESCDYMHRAKTRFWQHGFGIVHAEPSGRTHLTPVSIRDGRCVVNGELYSRKAAA